MNWLDLVLILSLGTGALLGVWIGLIRGAFAIAGVFLGTILVFHFRDDASRLLAEYVSSDTLAAALGYAVTIGVAVAGAVGAAAIVRGIAYRLFLGWVDRLAGLAMGLSAAAVVSTVVVVGLADYGSQLPINGLAGSILENTPHALEAKDSLLEAIRNSSLVSLLVEVTDTVPDKAMELVPSSFQTALYGLGQPLN